MSSTGSYRQPLAASRATWHSYRSTQATLCLYQYVQCYGERTLPPGRRHPPSSAHRYRHFVPAQFCKSSHRKSAIWTSSQRHHRYVPPAGAQGPLPAGIRPPAWTAHPVTRVTRRLIASRYLWKGLSTDVTAWARACLHCQWAKVHRHVQVPPQHMPVPTRCFSHIHVDLVGPLPPSKGFTQLFTVMDRTSR